MKGLVRVLQEPLVHFLLLGSALFVLAHYWGDSPAREQQETIVVTEGKIQSLAQLWQRTRQRPPTRAELEGLIQDYVDEEVFYREALAMGLERDDTIIRRRLRQKLEFVAEDLADAVEPTDEQLRAYLNQHANQFRLEERASFTQIYFSRQRRGDSLDDDVEQTLDQLRHSEAAIDLTQLGDPILLPPHHENLRASEITNLFGPQFSAGLSAAGQGAWTGPIESSYGLHLVLVHERTPVRVPELEEARDAVRREWYAARRSASKESFRRRLRERYKVVIEAPAAEGAGPADAVSDPRPQSETALP